MLALDFAADLQKLAKRASAQSWRYCARHRKTHHQNSGEVSPQVSRQLAARGEVSHDTVSRCNGVDVGLPNAVGSLPRADSRRYQNPMRGMIARLNANAVKKVRERTEKRSGRIIEAILSIGTVVFCGWSRVMNGASSTQTSIWD